jgi:hypothetical protein
MQTMTASPLNHRTQTSELWLFSAPVPKSVSPSPPPPFQKHFYPPLKTIYISRVLQKDLILK